MDVARENLFDVIVLGGGPAGCNAATCLLAGAFSAWNSDFVLAYWRARRRIQRWIIKGLSSGKEHMGRTSSPDGSAFAWVCLALLVVLSGLSGCRTAPPAPPIDLTQSGWTVQRGQAVWTAARGDSGVAGELLVATQLDGSCWIQFSKPPFNLFTAQRQANCWHIEFQQGRKQYGGRGGPPSQFIGFQLAKAACGQPPGTGWKFSREADDGWVLVNLKTGEKLEGYLSP